MNGGMRAEEIGEAALSRIDPARPRMRKEQVRRAARGASQGRRRGGDFLESAGQPEGIAREASRGGVGQEFQLP